MLALLALLALLPGVATAKTGAPIVADAWVRAGASPLRAVIVSLTVTSPVGDRLLGARVSNRVAATAELHRSATTPSSVAPTSTVTSTNDAAVPTAADAAATSTTTTATGSSTTRPMAMSMRPVEWIELPAQTAVSLGPGGPHVMLLGLAAPLRAGTSLSLSLRFARAGWVSVRVAVRER